MLNAAYLSADEEEGASMRRIGIGTHHTMLTVLAVNSDNGSINRS